MKDWQTRTPAELVAHIEGRRDVVFGETLPLLDRLVAEALAAGGAEETLEGIRLLLRLLKVTLEHHLLSEEVGLFPIVRGLGAARSPQAPEARKARYLVRHLKYEHDLLLAALARLGEAASDYALPPDAPQPLRALYDLLRALDADIREHIQLENELLFRGILAGAELLDPQQEEARTWSPN
ncbi:MAG TPA: hemerythrin domain-containing protein [Planctomycetota bacterium]|nr:hemerythrin domain-containing protein [Planctomycetota bacterium]